MVSQNMTNLFDNTVIENDALLKTDHNLIRVKLNLDSLETINTPNINRSKFVHSGQLRSAPNVEKYVLEADTKAQFYVLRPFDDENIPDKLRAALEEALDVLSFNFRSFFTNWVKVILSFT